MDPLLCIRSYRLIPEMDPRHLIVSITALVALGQAPPGKWFAKFCEVRPPARPRLDLGVHSSRLG